MPDLELAMDGVRADRDKVAAYAKVCGFTVRDRLPVTYPHVVAFPLQMAVMADGRFPFGAVGLVHIGNRIVQHRPLLLGEGLSVSVRTTEVDEHPKGVTFGLQTEVRAEGELAWESLSTMLKRGARTGQASEGAGQATEGAGEASEGAGQATEGAGQATEGAGQASERAASVKRRGAGRRAGELESIATWRLGGDLGRRYAEVSGDRNPIHMHPLSAKALGFPRAIAHGMWSKARCLAALEPRLPDAVWAEVAFRKPILLPGTVELAIRERDGEIDFQLHSAGNHTHHLEGCLGLADWKGAKQRRGSAAQAATGAGR